MLKVYLADFVEKTDLEGPGHRIALWFSGCKIRCSGCCNPHLFEQSENQKVDINGLFHKIEEIQKSDSDIEGLTVLGGEPFDQPEALFEILRFCKISGLSTMVFSGYSLGKIRKSRNARILTLIDLLVDGPYIESQREVNRRWIGSANQELHFMSDRYNDSMPCFSKPNEIEFKYKDGALHIYGYPTELVSQIEKNDKKSILKILNVWEDDHRKPS